VKEKKIIKRKTEFYEKWLDGKGQKCDDGDSEDGAHTRTHT
jgi:hypothetical protein